MGCEHPVYRQRIPERSPDRLQLDRPPRSGGRPQPLCAKIEEYRFDTVARALIDEAEGGLAEDDALRLGRWQQMLRWLFDAWNGCRDVLPSLTIQIVTAGGALRRATTCYLGPAYPGGQVVWQLYAQFGQDEFVDLPRHVACQACRLPRWRSSWYRSASRPPPDRNHSDGTASGEASTSIQAYRRRKDGLSAYGARSPVQQCAGTVCMVYGV